MRECIPCFSDKEYERRHQLVRDEMEKLGIDCLLVPSSDNLTYLTNIRYEFFGVYLLFPRVGDPTVGRYDRADFPDPRDWSVL